MTIATGFTVGLEQLTNLNFDPEKPYRACFICGQIFQSTLDREPTTLLHVIEAKQRRDDWAERHSLSHTHKEHTRFIVSGGRLTPEAAYKLAAFGIIDVEGLVLNDEVSDAYRTSSAIPQDDAEGG